MTRTLLLRIIQLILLIILMLLLANLWLGRASEVWWQRPVVMTIYPINADRHPLTQAFIDQLQPEHFSSIEAFFGREAARYRLALTAPVKVKLASQVHALPPQVPDDPSILDAILWSIRMRLWVWRYDTGEGEVDARIFLNYHLPGNDLARPQHSLGLQRGMIGLVNAYAGVDYQGQTSLIAVHEFLHTMGASDKYDPDTQQPIWPDGFADPTQAPLFPQTRAEIMGGRVQVSPGWALLPPDLRQVTIGSATAIEINWLAAPPAP
ncbi:hypothetical protein [Marinobacterium sediminicola]|uniref:Matrixin n=1 Tax=Marinobacterium sediminicola TaxID=518898 RepID=A0ABY1RYZ3_9GAMM|nr:hypothetical protein [Marinobacterium sediminicola]ULG68132.1 hypothetical protein LN244_10470 [Marinobacterium sediminicola]SMR73355.1 hypothetical protein SAMN04487964_10417 [Marinobacterium sediminicola]